MKYKSVFISDTHVGAKKCRIKKLNKFLEENTFEELHFVGDMVDIWRFKQALSLSKKKKKEHTKFFINILKLTTKGTKIFIYIGNHDIYLEKFMSVFEFENIKIIETGKYIDSLGKSWYIMHGHQLDFATKYSGWTMLGKLGDRGYDVLIKINEIYNYIRVLFGLKYHSVSKMVKIKFKKAISFIDNFEKLSVQIAHKNNCDGCITGHIHDPKLTSQYANCGCWTDEENLSFLYDKGNGIKIGYYNG